MRTARHCFDLESKKELLFSSKFSCPKCDYALAELEPRLFSFNNPMGACPKCDGLGAVEFFDARRVVAHPNLSPRRAARSRAGTGATISTTRC
jgi:excinuclease UvrABC ATPase subunit